MGWGTPTSMASHHCAARGVARLGRDALGKTRGERRIRDTQGSCQPHGEGASLVLPFSPPLIPRSR